MRGKAGGAVCEAQPLACMSGLHAQQQQAFPPSSCCAQRAGMARLPLLPLTRLRNCCRLSLLLLPTANWYHDMTQLLPSYCPATRITT